MDPCLCQLLTTFKQTGTSVQQMKQYRCSKHSRSWLTCTCRLEGRESAAKSGAAFIGGAVHRHRQPQHNQNPPKALPGNPPGKPPPRGIPPP